MKYISKIDGITYRNYKDEQDYESFTELINSYYQKLGIDRVDNANENKLWIEAQKTYDKTKHLTVAEYQGKPVSIHAYYYQKEFDGPYLFSHWFGVDGDWIESPLMQEHFDFVEAEMQAESKNIEGYHPVVIRAYYEAGKEEIFKKMLQERDYHEVRYFFDMSRPTSEPIPQHSLPDGIELKPADTEEKINRVMKAVDKAFEDHFGHTKLTDEMMEAWKQEDDFNPKLWKVAWDGDQVAGSILNFISKEENEKLNRSRGYTETISTLREYRKKGIAHALLTESIQMFKDMGLEETSLGVDSTNPSGALGLYESFGYKTYKSSVALDKKIR